VRILKSYEELTSRQRDLLKETDRRRSLAVHPTQLYESAGGAVLCVVLYSFWRRTRNAANAKSMGKVLARPGCIFSLMFVLYGILRFLMELLRDDNPFEFDGMTISQIISIGLVMAGLVVMMVFHRMVAGPRAR
jgi:prolipoprotein diacylglyceryltransferase